MFVFFVTVLVCTLIVGMTYFLVTKQQVKQSDDDIGSVVRKVAERAYFTGQRDAINGDIRIELNSDSVYFWSKSCWDNGAVPLYNPTYLDTKNGI